MPVPIAQLHPIIVHFPIALLITSVTLDYVAVIIRKRYLLLGNTWILALGVIGAFMAGITGSISEGHANTSQVGQLLSLHKMFGFATGFVFAVLLAMRLLYLLPDILSSIAPQFPFVDSLGSAISAILPGAGAKRIPAILIVLYMALSTIGIVLLAFTGYYGGSMVYDHGVGTPSGLLPFGNFTL